MVLSKPKYMVVTMRTAKKKPFSESRKYSKYKVINWSEYNKSLRKRGNIEFMISDNLSESWYEEGVVNNRKRGRQRVFSNKAITCCLQIAYLFGLPLRSAQGFIDYLFKKMGLKLKSPDYTSLSKRSQSPKIDYSSVGKNVLHVSLDSTGIQTFTGNEWLENKHGKQYNRRIWKKLHIAVDENGIILSEVTTSHKSDDRSCIEE